jgi:hypothetical protein
MDVYRTILQGISEDQYDDFKGQIESRQNWFFRRIKEFENAEKLSKTQLGELWTAWVAHQHERFPQPGIAFNPCKQEWEAYVEAAREAVEATEAAKPFVTFRGLKPGEQASELPREGMLAMRRLSRGNEVQAEKYKAWLDCCKSHGL